MANVTIAIPTGLVADFRAVIADQLGPEGVGLDTRAQYALWVRNQLAPLIKARRRAAGVDVTAEITARVTAETALSTETAARLAAEATVNTVADADLGGIA